MSQRVKAGTERVWLTVGYEPVSLFSLKRSDATSMAGRSNLVPTPYAIKMALLRVLLEREGYGQRDRWEAWLKPLFEWIRGLTVYVLPPERLVVNRNGYTLRYYDQVTDKTDKGRKTLPMQPGFVFREWVFLEGNLRICVGPSDRAEVLAGLFAEVNYFGKRGCFFQFLPEAIRYTAEPSFVMGGEAGFVVQPWDDLGPGATFGRINPFSGERAQVGRDRVIESGLLPLRLRSTGAKYDVYERY